MGLCCLWPHLEKMQDLAKDLLKFVQEGLDNGDPLVIGLLVAIAVVVLTICEYFELFSSIFCHEKGRPAPTPSSGNIWCSVVMCIEK